MQDPVLKIDGPKKARTCVVLAHGAGESSDSTFLRYFADGLAAARHRVVRFDFPYMAERSKTGRKKPPDKEPLLRETWHAVLEKLDCGKFVIGGKSMGGRIASLVADESEASGLVCLGYPFHPTGKPDRLRIEHLQSIATPTLIVQGERDPFGDREEVTAYPLSGNVRLHWVPDGDHSFKPRKSSGRTIEQNLKNSLRSVESFLFELWAE